MSSLPEPYKQFRDQFPEVYDAYESLGKAAAAAGPIDAKTRELIKLGMAAGTGSESGVQSHAHRLLEIGASAAEIQHTLVLGVNTLGFSRMMAALSWAKQAIADHKS
jgi:4-carboxymuconolactone decarboxylase